MTLFWTKSQQITFVKYFPLNVQKTFVTDIWEKNKNLILKWPEATQNKSHQKPKWIKNLIIYLQQKILMTN